MEKQHLKLKSADREHLTKLLSKGNLTVKVFKRATGLLELDRGKTLQAVAATLGVAYITVAGWRDKYQEEGLQCLQDKPRSGRPVELDGKLRAKITALACSTPPDGYGQWSLRLLADRIVELEYCDEISHMHVSRILKKTNCNRTSKKLGA
jgi:putative transposase